MKFSLSLALGFGWVLGWGVVGHQHFHGEKGEGNGEGEGEGIGEGMGDREREVPLHEREWVKDDKEELERKWSFEVSSLCFLRRAPSHMSLPSLPHVLRVVFHLSSEVRGIGSR